MLLKIFLTKFAVMVKFHPIVCQNIKRLPEASIKKNAHAVRKVLKSHI